MGITRRFANLGKALDSASTSHFLSVLNKEGLFRDVLWTEISGRPNVLDSADVSSIITADVDKPFVDALNIDADTLDGQQGTYYLDYNNFTNTPNILDSANVNTLVSSGVANVVDAAPASLDTLNELAAALDDDANFATTVTNLINALPDSSQVSTIVSTDVTKTFVDNLNVDADTLDGQQGTYYLDYSNFTNTPTIPEIGTDFLDSARVSAIITADVDKAFIDALNIDADTLDGQQGTYYLDYSNFTNTPNVLDSTDVNALVTTGVDNLVASAPASLDTLNELAAALNDDANFAATVTSQIAALPDSSQVSTIITTDVDKTFVDNLNVNADTLDGQQGTYYLDYNNATNAPNVLDSSDVTSIIDASYIQANQTNYLDSSAATSLIDSAYVASKVSVASGFAKYRYLATDGQTTFSGADTLSNTLSYDSGGNGILVFYNGVLLDDSDDYTATNGTSVVLVDGADSGVTLQITTWAGSNQASQPEPEAPVAGVFYGDRALYAGGNLPSGAGNTNVIDYRNITLLGTANDFGDLTSTRNEVAGTGDDTRGLFQAAYMDIDYVTISTTSNSTDFGNLANGQNGGVGAVGDGTYAVFAGGYFGGTKNTIDRVTVQTIGNATDFGDLGDSKYYKSAMVGNGTRGVIGGGWNGSTRTNQMEYMTLSTTSNSTNFGTLNSARYGLAGASGTYSLFAGGNTSAYVNTIDWIQVDTLSNSSDAGDLTQARMELAGTSNYSRAVFAGGIYNSGGSVYVNTIDYRSTGVSALNASDYGDLSVTRRQLGATSGD